MDIKEFLEMHQEDGTFDLDDLFRICQKQDKMAFITVMDDPNSPEGRAIEDYIDSHHLLPPNYQDTPGEEIERQGARLFEPATTIREKKKILMLLAHLGVYESFKILKKYQQNPDPELHVWARMALDECQTFVKQNLSDDTVHSLTILAQTGRNDPCPCGSGKKFKRCCGKG